MNVEYEGKTVDLGLCPFCGSTTMVHGYRNRMRKWYRIRCSNDRENCTIVPETMAYLTLKDAATAWNLRP